MELFKPEDRINIGDLVIVNFNNVQYCLSSRALVLYMPLEQGDCWIFKDQSTGTIYYVSEGCTITKL